MDNKIKEIYQDPKYGLISPVQIQAKLKEKGIIADIDEIKEVLSGLESYSLNRPIKKKYATRKVIAKRVYEQLQADLAFMDSENHASSKDNDGVKYLLTIIDVFSKYAWVIPLKEKKAEGIVKAFEPIFSEINPETLQVDEGKEFYNKQFESLLKKYNVTIFSTHSDKKASVIERFNRTLKMRISKLFDVTNSFRYIDVLPDLVWNYNNTIHSTIKMKPIDAIKDENYWEVYDNFYSSHDLKHGKPKFKIGNYVRIPKYKNQFSKEIIGNYTIEIFRIKTVKNTQPPTYRIEDLLGEEIEGSYYENELLKVPDSVLKEPKRIEKVIKTRNNKQESLVKWLGLDDKFNEWIPSKDIKEIS